MTKIKSQTVKESGKSYFEVHYVLLICGDCTECLCIFVSYFFVDVMYIQKHFNTTVIHISAFDDCNPFLHL